MRVCIGITMFLWATSKNLHSTTASDVMCIPAWCCISKDRGFEKQNNLPSAFRVISKGSGNWFWHYIRGIFFAHKHCIYDTSMHSTRLLAGVKCTIQPWIRESISVFDSYNFLSCLAGSNGMLHTKCSQT